MRLPSIQCLGAVPQATQFRTRFCHCAAPNRSIRARCVLAHPDPPANTLSPVRVSTAVRVRPSGHRALLPSAAFHGRQRTIQRGAIHREIFGDRDSGSWGWRSTARSTPVAYVQSRTGQP